jgi:hypothetical protein
MAERRPLIEGLKTKEASIDPAAEKAFILGGKPAAEQILAASSTPPSAQSVSVVQARVPISTRMRSDFAAALKRASLERQLDGVEPNTLQDILEQAVEPWLRSNGYLK